MKEVSIFENWSNLILEGTWAIPDTKEKQAQLLSLLSQELPVGPDATNATEQLYDLLGDDELFDRLEELADQNANADARDIILTRLEQLKSNPAIAQVIGQLKTPTSDDANPVSEEQVDELGGTGFRRVFKNGEWVTDPNVKEDDQIDELSPDTLKSYIKKASSSSDERSSPNLASMAAAKLHGPFADDDDGEADDHKAFMRSKGIGRAVDKLEELSPDTLKSYAKDAALDNARRGNTLGYLRGKPTRTGELEKDIGDKIARRQQGINKAINRLEESAMSEISMMFDEWMNSEYAPLTSDAGDSNEIMRKAAAFLQGQVPPEKIDDYAEYMARYYEGDLNENGVTETDAAGALSNETVGGGSYLEDKNNIVDQMVQVQDEIEKIVRAGGRVGLNDPLSQKLKMLKAKLHRSKSVNENTALTGQYGHSGKMEEVTSNDKDIMDRIKFLAGIKETDTTNGQENSNLTTMKSVSSIFIR